MKKVIILEDTDSVSKYLALVAKKCGWDSVIFPSVEDLIANPEVFNDAAFMISDFDLADQTAIGAYKFMKANNINIPVVLHSGNLVAPDIIDDNGCSYLIDDVLPKPADLSQLRNLFNKY